MQDFKTLVQEHTTHKCLCRIGDGSDCPLHWHESLEVCQLLTGSLKILVDGTVYDMRAGDVVCINAAIPHLTYDAEKGTRLRVFRTLPSNLMQLSVSVNQLKTYIPHSQIKAVDGLSEKLDFALEILTEQNDVTCDESRPFIQSLAASVYFLLAEHFADEDTYKSKNKERKLFFKTLDFVNAHFTEPINVSIVARELFYPRSKLSAIFTKYSGIKLGDYINGLRVQRVGELISSGVGITEAAFSSGFQNIRSFNNVYKEAMGISPSEFLKRNA